MKDKEIKIEVCAEIQDMSEIYKILSTYDYESQSRMLRWVEQKIYDDFHSKEQNDQA